MAESQPLDFFATVKFTSKTVVLTGASLGLGRATAEAFVREGAHLLLCARTAGPLEQAAEELRELAIPGRQVLWKTCDVSDETQVTALADFAQKELGGCDVLINNAGIQGAIGPIEDISWENWRRTIEVDLFGVALPCRSFIPGMKKAGGGKIINISGGGATSPRPFFSAYASAKAAVVRLTETLAEELRPYHIDVNAIAPGALNTRLLDEILKAGPERVGADVHARALKQNEKGGTSPGLGADLCVFLASSACNGITGRLISAPWDPWGNLEDLRDELADSDIYTLRRIVPEDRGKNWGKLE